MSLALSAFSGAEGAASLRARVRLAMSGCDHLFALLAMVGLGFALLHSGGREEEATNIGLLLAVPSFVLGRPWLRLPLLEAGVAAALSVAAVTVPLVTTLGVANVGDLAAYTYPVVLFVALRGFATDGERRRLVALCILALAIVESVATWTVWIGENNPSFHMVGTFYWHNQFGIFAAAIGTFSCGFAMRSGRVEDAIAWLVAPLCVAFTLLSHSRGAELGLALGGSTLFVVGLRHRQWWPLLRLASVAVLGIGIRAVYMGSVGGGSSANSDHGNLIVNQGGLVIAHETAQQAGHFRRAVSEAALQVFAHSPLTSHGMGSLGVIGWRWTSPGITPASWAHSAELQALSDGGLLLGLPVVAALSFAAWSTLRVTRSSIRSDQAVDWVRLGAAGAVLAMLLHTSMDFDSQYPVLTALLATFVVLVLPRTRPPRRTTRRVITGAVLTAATVTGAAMSALLVHAYWHTTRQLGTAAALMQNDSARGVAIARDALDHHQFRDPRPAEFVIESTELGYVFDDATLQRAFAETRDYARFDTIFAATRDRVAAEHDGARATPP